MQTNKQIVPKQDTWCETNKHFRDIFNSGGCRTNAHFETWEEFPYLLYGDADAKLPNRNSLK